MSARRGRKCLPFTALVIALGVLAQVRPAHADVGFWDGVRDSRAHVRAAARRLVLGYAALPDSREVTAACLTVLPFASADLKYLCGARLGRAHDGMKQKALGLLNKAIQEAPESPWVGQAWFEVGVVEAELGHPERAIRAFSSALERVWQPSLRAHLHYKRGLAYMLRGELRYATSDYRLALLLGSGSELFAMAQASLGVALERQGDLASALAAFSAASSVQPVHSSVASQGLGRAVPALMPVWESYYYKALAAMAEGEQAGTPQAREVAYRQAVLAWSAYLDEGRKVSAHWLDHAEALRSRCESKVEESVGDRSARAFPR